MTWETVAQVLVIFAAASGYMWVSGREPREPVVAAPENHLVAELRTLMESKQRLLKEHASDTARGYYESANKDWVEAERVQKRIEEVEAELNKQGP